MVVICAKTCTKTGGRIGSGDCAEILYEAQWMKR